MQNYSTAPGRNAQVSSGPPAKAKGLVNSNMPKPKAKAKPKRKSKGK